METVTYSKSQGPFADDNGWVLASDSIEPKWFEGSSLPPGLVDILAQNDDSNENESDGESSSDSD